MGKMAFISGEQRSNFKGNRRTKTILGNRGTKTILETREHKKIFFRLLGIRVASQFILGEQGNRYPAWKAYFFIMRLFLKRTTPRVGNHFVDCVGKLHGLLFDQ